MVALQQESNRLIAAGIASVGFGLASIGSQSLRLLGGFDAGERLAAVFGILALVLGGYLYTQTAVGSVSRRLSVVAVVSAAVALLPTPLALITVPTVIVLMYSRLKDANAGWRWWAGTLVAVAGGLVLGTIVVTIALLLIGTGDPRWNLPRWYGISVEMLDYLTITSEALIAAAIGGLAGTRSLTRALFVTLATVVAVSLFWLIAVHPQHTNDITWGFSLSLGILYIGTVIACATAFAWLLRPDGGRLESHRDLPAGT